MADSLVSIIIEEKNFRNCPLNLGYKKIIFQ